MSTRATSGARSRIAAGPDGVTCRARDAEGNIVEWRRLEGDPLRRDQLHRRLRIARLIDHPTARQVVAYDAAEGRLVVEWLAGGPAERLLAGRLPRPEPAASGPDAAAPEEAAQEPLDWLILSGKTCNLSLVHRLIRRGFVTSPHFV